MRGLTHVAVRAGPVGRNPLGDLAAVAAFDAHGGDQRRLLSTEPAVRTSRTLGVRDEVPTAVRAFYVHRWAPLLSRTPLKLREAREVNSTKSTSVTGRQHRTVNSMQMFTRKPEEEETVVSSPP